MGVKFGLTLREEDRLTELKDEVTRGRKNLYNEELQ
jgi:hypothetical protein